MRPAGFRTDDEHGSLYAIDDQQYTVRHNLSGHSAHGTIDPPAKCLYLTEAQRNLVHAHMHAENSKLRVVYLDKKTRLLHTWKGNDADMPAGGHPGIAIVDKASDKIIDSWPASDIPAVGLTPFEMRYARDPQGGLIASRHLGHPIYKIYPVQAEFDEALKKAGFKAFFASSPATRHRPAPSPG